jgi:choline dehydrogenase-like flavoprotein
VVEDANAGNPLGVAEIVENWREGKRQIASDAYDLSSVNVVTDALVRKILVEERDGEKVAIGVELVDGRTVKAGREVILSAGANRTPQVSMLSGIGPAEDLDKLSIEVILDLREVGRNFFDHSNLFTFWKLKHQKGDFRLALNCAPIQLCIWDSQLTGL